MTLHYSDLEVTITDRSDGTAFAYAERLDDFYLSGNRQQVIADIALKLRELSFEGSGILSAHLASPPAEAPPPPQHRNDRSRSPETRLYRLALA